MSTIRTAQAFGTQNVLASLYDVAIEKAYTADCGGAIAQGVGMALFFFCLYASYSLGKFCARALLSPRAYLYAHVPSIQLWGHAHQ